jgi:hypothetical protein
MNPQIYEFESTEYDINSLFNFNYNFDQLKYLLMSLMKSHKLTTQKIIEIQESIKDKEERIIELEQQSNNQDIFLSSQYNNFKSVKIEGVSNQKDTVNKIKLEPKKIMN